MNGHPDSLKKQEFFPRNDFNDQRNLAIVTTTMATREAIAGGVSPADAYRLSDYLINQIDRCQKIEEITELNRRSIYKFTKLVADTRKTRSFSSYTEQCKDYISQNYHHKIYHGGHCRSDRDQPGASVPGLPSGYRRKNSGLHSEIPGKKSCQSSEVFRCHSVRDQRLCMLQLPEPFWQRIQRIYEDDSQDSTVRNINARNFISE